MDITNTILESIVPFSLGGVFGSVIGWYAHSAIKVKDSPDSMKFLMATVVLLVWSMSVIIDMFAINYATPWAVHALVGGVIGSFFEFDFTQMIKQKK